MGMKNTRYMRGRDSSVPRTGCRDRLTASLRVCSRIFLKFIRMKFYTLRTSVWKIYFRNLEAVSSDASSFHSYPDHEWISSITIKPHTPRKSVHKLRRELRRLWTCLGNFIHFHCCYFWEPLWKAGDTATSNGHPNVRRTPHLKKMEFPHVVEK